MNSISSIFISILYFIYIVNCQESDQCRQACHLNGECSEIQLENGVEHCCTCKDGYVGNGQNCLILDGAVTIRGTTSGTVNNVELDNVECHAYIDTTTMDGRSYVALGEIPREVGKSSELLITFASPIYWLFATSDNNRSVNGFKLSGGVFKRVSDATFYDQNNQVIGNLHIEQVFSGLNGNSDEIKLHSKIQGELPKYDNNMQVFYPDFHQKFQHKHSFVSDEYNKLVESHGAIKYRVLSLKDSNYQADYNIVYTDRIYFNRCKVNDEQLLDVSVNPKRLLTTFVRNNQVRFASANFLYADGVYDPCDGNSCNIFSECVPDENNRGYFCQCKPGFEEDENQCIDQNECESDNTNCSPHATCKNLYGYYDCECNAPYVGDGRTCELQAESPDHDVCSRCDPNADCVPDVSQYVCRCRAGYYGNGFDCRQEYVPDSHEEHEEKTTTVAPKVVDTLFSNYREHSDDCQSCDVFAACEKQRNGGECCRCLEGYVGNGKYCFAEASQIMITGKVEGVVNGHNLENMDFFASILTLALDSRNHVALGNIPTDIAASMQILLSIVSPINWLFAGPQTSGVSLNDPHKDVNGFTLTGGLFKRRCNLTFYDERQYPVHSLQIVQEFYGLDIQESDKSNRISVKTELHGSIPSVNPDAKIHYRDHKQRYSHLRRGYIQSFGELDYEVTYLEDTRVYQSYKVRFEDEITFSECPHSPLYGESVSRVNTKGVYIIHVKGDNLVRFSSVNFIHAEDAEDDPCELNDCSIYAECTPDANSERGYKCACRIGFDGDGNTCYDIDECANGEAACDENAICYNSLGHYECRCKSPYKGSGTECKYDFNCKMCSQNAKCVEDYDGDKCVCNDGWKGDGFQCTAVAIQPDNCGCDKNADCLPNYGLRKYECRCKLGFEGDGYRCNPVSCHEVNNCHADASCEQKSDGSFECECLKGFYGDGYECSVETCDVLANCGDNARCVADPLTQFFRCECLAGFVGNGYRCVRDIKQCNILNNCHPNAECLLDNGRHQCKCKPGYTGDGNQCIAKNSCRDKQNICDVNGYCIYDTNINDFVCKCNPGFEGDGLYRSCNPVGDGPVGLSLVYAQGVSLHKVSFKFNEQDNIQPYKNRIVYIPHQTAIAVDFDCHEQYVYWTDVSTKVVNKIRPDGSKFEVVLQGLQSPEGLAVDWISRNLYITDSKAKTIEVASLNGKYRKVLIKSNLNNPRGIAVDPIDGYIFWCDWNRKSPKIERANMDGSHRRTIVSDNLGLPNGIYYDHRRLEICWADAKTRRIECVQRDGSARRNVTHVDGMHPFDLVEVGSNMYWSDWSRKDIQTVSKSGVAAKSIKLAPGGNGRVYGIAVVRNSCPAAVNRCAFTNGGCSYICVPLNDGEHKCLCPDDVEECTNKYSL